MVNPAAVTRRLLVLNECLNELARPEAAIVERLATDSMLRAAVERWLQTAIESCVDIASHVLASEGWVPASTGREAFLILAQHGRISLELAERLGRAAAMRNVLVHDYVALDLTKLAHVVQNDLNDLRAFAAEVALWMGDA